MLERHHRTGVTAPAFREDDEDGFFVLQFPAQIGQGMRSAIFSPHWQRVEHDCRERAGHIALKEDVPRRDGESAFTMAGSQGGSKNQRVKMTAMIRCKHKRTVRRQLLAAFDRESMRDREISSQKQKTNFVREAFEKSAFASHAAKPLARRKASIARRLELPGFHWD